MVLSKENKNKLRDEILQQLDSVTSSEKIHIDKDILEELLFDVIVYDDKGSILKLPVWTGTFLRKIDLSEVSFEDVSWSLLSNLDYGVLSVYLNESALDKIEELKSINNGDVVDFSFTNANINFKESFEGKKNRGIEIRACNFSGVDLSNNTTKNLVFAYQTDFSNTNLKVLNKNDYCWFVECNLEGIDLSNFDITGLELIDYASMPSRFSFCNLKDTGINVLVTDEMYEDNEIRKTIGLSSVYIRGMFEEYLSNGNLDNCILNGKKVESSSSRVRK